jgi:hypothetical protein
MKIISTFFKSIFSLRSIGLVMVLMAGIILVATFSQASGMFFTAINHMDMLDILENQASYELGAMQLNEAYQTFYFEYVYEQDTEIDDSYIQNALESNTNIDSLLATLDNLSKWNLLPENAEIFSQQIGQFNDLRSTHRVTFDQMVTAYQAGDYELAQQSISQIQQENEVLNQILKDMIVMLEQDRSSNLAEFPGAVNADITRIAVGFSLTLLLALLGYQLIAATTRPLHSLINAITAIGGNQYRSELLGNLKKSSSPAGKLALALDQLATAVQQHSAGLQNKIEQQRSELYESRRRRLKIARPADNPKENQ